MKADENLRHKEGEMKMQTLEVGHMNAAKKQSSGPLRRGPIRSGAIRIGPNGSGPVVGGPVLGWQPMID